MAEKLDPIVFYRTKLSAVAQENQHLQLELAQMQENLARYMAENAALKKKLLQPTIKELQEQFDGLKKELELNGTPIESIDWETGEVKRDGNPGAGGNSAG